MKMMNNPNDFSILEREISTFFRQFALTILHQKHIDVNDKRAFKVALIDYYEQIYPAFSQTEVFKRCFEKEHHEQMVEAYKENFFLLLQGTLPPALEKDQNIKP